MERWFDIIPPHTHTYGLSTALFSLFSRRTFGMQSIFKLLLVLWLISEEPEVYRPKTILEIRREAPDENFRDFVRRVERHVTPRYRQYVQVVQV